MLEGAAEVVVLALELLEGLALTRARQLALGLLREREEPLGVPAPEVVDLSCAFESLERVLPDRREHRQPLLVGPPEQAVVEERGEVVEIGVADALGGFDPEPAREHRQSSEDALLPLGEQVVAPRNGSPQCLLPRRQVARPTGEQLEPPVEPRQQLLRAEQLDARGSELERQGEPVDPRADGFDDGFVLLGEPEAGVDGGRAAREELQRLEPRERRHRILALDREAQGRPARHEQLECGAGREKSRDGRCGANHLLEVVQHEQQPAPAQRFCQCVEQVGARYLSDSRGLRDLGRHERSIRDGSERHEGDAVRELRRDLRRHLERESRLAGAAGAGQGQETDVVASEERAYVRHLVAAPDERRRRWRQVPQRRGRRDRGGESPILVQDRPVQRLELRRRVDAELLDEGAAHAVVSFKRFRLPSRAVQRKHQLAVEPLPERVFGDERLELGHELDVAAERQLRFDPRLEAP